MSALRNPTLIDATVVVNDESNRWALLDDVAADEAEARGDPAGDAGLIGMDRAAQASRRQMTRLRERAP